MVVVENLKGVERSDVRRRSHQVVDVERCTKRRKRGGAGSTRLLAYMALPHTTALKHDETAPQSSQRDTQRYTYY